jgi:spore coat polysaccharide biosynthesis protein SpsF
VDYIFIQARIESTRFPGKALQKIGNQTSLELCIDRCKETGLKVTVVSPMTTQSIDKIAKICTKKKALLYLGSMDNVLQRFYFAGQTVGLKNNDRIIRITADCPFIDPKMIIAAIKFDDYDYITNCYMGEETYPDGLDINIFTYKLLREAYYKSWSKEEKEHIIPHFINNKRVKVKKIISKKDNSHIRITLDYKDDLKLLRNIYDNVKELDHENIVKYLEDNPELLEINKHIRNEALCT